MGCPGAYGADTKNGTIPIVDGVLLVSKAKDLLTAAAMAMFSKRKIYSGKPTKEASSYIESLLLGQTEVASYVVNVIAPMQAVVEQQAIEGAEPVVGVALSLAHGLEALVDAGHQFDETKDPTVFENAVAKGVSANMCDALLGFAGVDQKRDFEIRISGASGPMFDGEARVFSFRADNVPSLKAASSFYKDDYILPRRRIVGFVKKLYRDRNADVGKVAVEADVNGLVRSIQIELDAKEYHEASMANDKKLWIECFGDVHVKGRTTNLVNHSGLKIIRAGELFDEGSAGT